ncbi:MAG: methyltransferase domain-containing protein [Acidobacteria bacterium]|nr:methyltransferase domain-containing protein [Acidobacteriota bacterium]
MLRRFRQRSYELEHLDTGDYTAEEYEGCLAELRRVNRWLGDAHALKATLLPELRRAAAREFSLLDVGAGSGELLRVAAREARRGGWRAELVGLELNRRSARAIREESRGLPEIAAVRGDALRLPFADGAFDYVVCSLFTHHFRDDGVRRVLGEMARVARRRVIVIDLHRHALAYFLYTTAGKIFLRNRLIRADGALSIRRGFRAGELRRLAREAGWRDAEVRRRFPFRLVLSGSIKLVTEDTESTEG